MRPCWIVLAPGNVKQLEPTILKVAGQDPEDGCPWSLIDGKKGYVAIIEEEPGSQGVNDEALAKALSKTAKKPAYLVTIDDDDFPSRVDVFAHGQSKGRLKATVDDALVTLGFRFDWMDGGKKVALRVEAPMVTAKAGEAMIWNWSVSQVTRLPQRVSLDLNVKSTDARGPRLTICDQRVPGNDLAALDGAVIERASGDQRSPRDPRWVVSVLGFYLHDHFELRNNRIRIQRRTVDQVELTWEATLNNVDQYTPGSPSSVMRAALTLAVEERELVRVYWMTTDLQRLSERAAEHISDATTQVHTEMRSRLAERGRELAAAGWFEGRSIHAIELAVRVMPTDTDAPPQCGPIADGVAMVHIHVSRKRFETDRAGAGAAILAEVDRALPLLDVLHPRAPRLLRS